MTRGLSRGRVVLAVLVLGVLGVGVATLPWARVDVPTVLAGQTVTLSGSQAAPVTTAASLAVLAAGLAVALGGRWVTRLAAAALAGLAVLLAASAVGFVLDPVPGALTAAAEVSGVREISDGPTLTVAPYVTVVLGLLILAAAVLVLRLPATTSRRFERGEGSPPPRPVEGGRVRAMDDWDALGRGEDPSTRDDG